MRSRFRISLHKCSPSTFAINVFNLYNVLNVLSRRRHCLLALFRRCSRDIPSFMLGIVVVSGPPLK